MDWGGIGEPLGCVNAAPLPPTVCDSRIPPPKGGEGCRGRVLADLGIISVAPFRVAHCRQSRTF